MRTRKLALICASALALTGVGMAKPAKPAHALLLDFPAQKTPVPAPVKAVGPMTLIMRGLDKITGRATTILIPIGKATQYATLTINARYCYSTPSTETPETAAFVQIDDHRPDQAARRVFSGWMYASSPGLNGMEHPLYDAWVMTCRTVAPGETVVIGPAKQVRPVSPDAPEVEKPTDLPADAGQ